MDTDLGVGEGDVGVEVVAEGVALKVVHEDVEVAVVLEGGDHIDCPAGASLHELS